MTFKKIMQNYFKKKKLKLKLVLKIHNHFKREIKIKIDDQPYIFQQNH